MATGDTQWLLKAYQSHNDQKDWYVKYCFHQPLTTTIEYGPKKCLTFPVLLSQIASAYAS